MNAAERSAIISAGAASYVGGDEEQADVGATVPATLSLTLGTPATFGAFTPGVAREYTASTTANVISTAGDATLTASDPSSNAPGHLVNGSFSLPQPLQVAGSSLPATVKTYAAPVSNDVVTVGFKPVDRGDRRAAHRHLRQDADVHALDHEPVSAQTRTAARSGRRFEEWRRRELNPRPRSRKRRRLRA